MAGEVFFQSRRATGLRHAPDYREIILGKTTD